MIDVYSWVILNGYKVYIMFEEMGFVYCVYLIDIGVGDQFEFVFLKISLNNKIFVIVDLDGFGG